jgi:hypothetical protein
VWCEHPPGPRRHAANRADRTQLEFPSILRQTSSGPSWGLVGRVSTAKRTSGGTPIAGRGRDGQGVCQITTHTQVGSFVAISGQKPWPSTGCFVTAYGQFFMAADTRSSYTLPGVAEISLRRGAEQLLHERSDWPEAARRVGQVLQVMTLTQDARSCSSKFPIWWRWRWRRWCCRSTGCGTVPPDDALRVGVGALKKLSARQASTKSATPARQSFSPQPFARPRTHPRGQACPHR